jgi:SynChlorMet cassette protein ScmC
MRLNACGPNGHAKLVFVRRGSGAGFPGESGWEPAWNVPGLPAAGWKPRNFKSLLIWTNRNGEDAVCELGEAGNHEMEITMMWQSLTPVYGRTLEKGGLPLHAALVERNGAGVLLAAGGGTGKSTCCRRIPPPWKALGDDLALAVEDPDGAYRVHPFPTWSDHLWRRAETTWEVERHLPLAAVVFLEQGAADRIVPVGKGEAAAGILESALQVCQSFWRSFSVDDRRSLKEKAFHNACGMAGSVPAFRLSATLDGCFWEELEKVKMLPGSSSR